MEQTVYLGTTTTDIVVYVQSIDSSGTHSALSVDTTQTKLVFADGTQSSVVPTVTALAGTGKAKITFSSVTNSGNLASGDTCAVLVHGSAGGVTFSPYLIPVFIDSAGGGGGGLTQADVRSAIGMANADMDSRLDLIDQNVDSVLVDTSTDIPAQISALNNFDPASDTVTVGTNNDKTGYTISGTKQTLDSLNDVAATDIVSGGAITTSGGAVSNVTTVATTTTNSDMRGTDNALLASSAPSNFGSLGINSSGHILRTVLNDTTTTNSDMVSVSGLAQSSEIAALNDISAADVWSYSTRTITSGGITAGEVSDAVWDVALSGYNSAGSTGKALRQVKEGIISQDGSVNDTSATTTSFVTNLASAVDGFYHDKVLVFISGSLLGQARHIEDYNGTTKAITLSVPLTSAPSNGSEFLILSGQSFSLNEHADAVWDEQRGSSRASGSFGYYVDAAISGIAVSGGDASSANQTTIIGHLTDIKGGTFSGSTDSLEAIRDRGDAAWTTSGAGIYTLTCTVKDASDNLISGARVNLDGTTSTATSNAQGLAVFNVDAGSYTLVTSPPSGYQTPANVSVTISADSTATIVLTQTSDAGDAGWLG